METEPLLHARGESLGPQQNIEDADATESPSNDEIDYRHESVWILRNSLQLAGTYLLQYFYNLVIIIVASRLRRNELAAVSIGVTTMNICGFAVFEGIATSLDTLCSQAFGSRNLTHVGLRMQRNILLLLLVALPVGAVWISSPWILEALIPQPQLAPMAGEFLRISLIGVPGYAIFEGGKRFVQSKGDFTASLVCWRRPTWDVLRNWGPMVSLSVPGAIITFCEWFTFEILTFTTSYLGVTHLAAQTILATVCVLLFHIPFSADVAVSTRVGYLIGADALSKAKGLVKLYAPLFAACGILEMTLLFLLGKPIARVLTQDAEVQGIVIKYMPLVAIFVVFDATLCCCHGILRGLGRQAVAGWVVFFINYLYALPLAVYLELGPPHLGVSGVWIGTTTCLILVTTTESIVMGMMNWQKCVDEAKGREDCKT